MGIQIGAGLIEVVLVLVLVSLDDPSLWVALLLGVIARWPRSWRRLPCVPDPRRPSPANPRSTRPSTAPDGGSRLLASFIADTEVVKLDEASGSDCQAAGSSFRGR